MVRRAPRASGPAPQHCPLCGAGIHSDGKSTASGRELWTYFCDGHCGWLEVYDGGVSLAKAMSDRGEPAAPPAGPAAPWWKFWAR